MNNEIESEMGKDDQESSLVSDSASQGLEDFEEFNLDDIEVIESKVFA